MERGVVVERGVWQWRGVCGSGGGGVALERGCGIGEGVWQWKEQGIRTRIRTRTTLYAGSDNKVGVVTC